jgi:hypothetical protein
VPAGADGPWGLLAIESGRPARHVDEDLGIQRLRRFP